MFLKFINYELEENECESFFVKGGSRRANVHLDEVIAFIWHNIYEQQVRNKFV